MWNPKNNESNMADFFGLQNFLKKFEQDLVSIFSNVRPHMSKRVISKIVILKGKNKAYLFRKMPNSHSLIFFSQ